MADAREAAFEKYQHQLEAEKVTKHQRIESNRILKHQEEEAKRAQRAVEKEERDRQRMQECAAIDARKEQRRKDKEACNTQKALQLPQTGKRKASKPLAKPMKKQRSGAAACRGVVEPEPAPAPCTHKTRSGQTATLYN
ncbi:hypothetical protein BU25DRAFT_480583 [Macroventuria anomochaeta]|uniref:Uncharacterized protein n=1 Tax=Macroventuria anomochaeta TaxID=301207 RepID=A0ACB6RKU1_9PLEO|nr:uncharacterized protein BU25DRAFT_480583 [Macroventuria anomochaeta]KAF2622322.1 hypothetical protein BU25DRAFT_480583 [Macroventuria anomochaeta]